MDKLIFLTNELQNPHIIKQMRIPLEFVRFGISEGRMYKHYNNKSTFILPVNALKKWGNSVVYGGIFICKDFDYYCNILDAYHICSLSTLFRNHSCDLHHRVEVPVRPIHFSTLSELAHLKYKEGEPITLTTYLGNLKHPKIKQRLNNSKSYRVIDGMDKEHFKQLFWEVCQWIDH